MAKIIEFKTKETQYNDWLETVTKQLKTDNVKSVLIMWEKGFDDGTSQAIHARFECDYTNAKWFYNSLGSYIDELTIRNYLKEHINEFIQYIEQ